MKALLEEKQKYGEKKKIIQEKVDEVTAQAVKLNKEKDELDNNAKVLHTRK